MMFVLFREVGANLDLQVLGLILGLVGTLGAGAFGLLAAWQYKKMGGGEVQFKLNNTYKALADGLEKTLNQRNADLAECLDKVNEFLHGEEERAKEQRAKERDWEQEKVRWRKERMGLKQEIDDLRDQVRNLTLEVRNNANS